MKPRGLVWMIACLFFLLNNPGLAAGQETEGGATPGVRIFNFEKDAIGLPPAGFTSYATGDGPAGKWVVQEMADAPSGKRVVAQTDAEATDNRFPVLIAGGEEFADVDVSVKGKAISGKVDQGIGLVFRFRDPQRYYVVRANALEDNVRLYKMVNGRRKQLAGASARVASMRWYTLRVVARGQHIICYFDGQKVIDVNDDTYTLGKVGLWTKADSVTAFDNLTVMKP